MRDKPLVSILINNYNYGRFLREAIDSALNQTYSDTEVIVVDDGSTDDSQEIIASYGEKIIPVFKENGGQASAFNAGFAVSKGDLICLLDSDDVWLPNKVEATVEATSRYPEATLIYHRVQPIDVHRAFIGEPKPETILNGQICERVVRSGGWWDFPPTSGMSFKRSFFEPIMPVPEKDYRICADSYLGDLAPFIGPVIGLDNALALYRLHGRNNWVKTTNSAEEVEFIKSRLKFYESRVRVLNTILEKLDFPKRVSLKNNFPYWLLRYMLGEATNFLWLVWLGLYCPADPSLLRRVKIVGGLLTKGHSMKIKL